MFPSLLPPLPCQDSLDHPVCKTQEVVIPEVTSVLPQLIKLQTSDIKQHDSSEYQDKVVVTINGSKED